jgi:putative ATPase
MDLFEDASVENEPLAARMRPRNLEEFVGQEHIVGPGRLLRRAIDADQLSSLIFYGPPGTGKTTLARVIAGSTESRFVTLNAVLAGVADIRREIAAAKDARSLHNKRTILFVDEVHRWNKSQQDALLPWVENGTVVLIGATTENPYFEVNKALVSRSRVFQLTGLDEGHLMAIARQTLEDAERGYGRWNVVFEPGALEHLVDISAGDARSLLNALQLAVETTPESFPPNDREEILVSLAAAEESIQRKVVLYDKEGDYHFDTISAFHQIHPRIRSGRRPLLDGADDQGRRGSAVHFPSHAHQRLRGCRPGRPRSPGHRGILRRGVRSGRTARGSVPPHPCRPVPGHRSEIQLGPGILRCPA